MPFLGRIQHSGKQTGSKKILALKNGSKINEVYPYTFIGVGRLRILGGAQGGGANSQQAHDVVMTSMRRNDVASTSFWRHVPTRFLINQCQIITFLIWYYRKFKDKLRGIVLLVPSNQIKVAFIIILPFNLVHLWYFLFHIEIEGKCGWIIWGGQRVCCPPTLSNYWGSLTPPPPPPPPPSPLPTPMTLTLNFGKNLIRL